MLRIKKLIPSSLYGRFLMILFISGLVVQLVSIYVFFYTHLDVVSKHMARSVIAEIAFVKSSLQNSQNHAILKELAQNTGLEFSIESRKRLKTKKIADSDWRKSKFFGYINPIIDPYNRFKLELENHDLTPYEIYENSDNSNLITVRIGTKIGIINFEVPVKKITSSSGYVFTFWMMFSVIATSAVSAVFFRNQTKLLKILTEMAEKFGRGQEVENIRPAGSLEIRSLTISFIKMKERVLRQIAQRTDMLSAVSHDLRTPLTRMKLQLELMQPSEEVNELNKDISEMQKLVEEYLDFARLGEVKEKSVPTKIYKFLQDNIVSYYAKMGREISFNFRLSQDFQILIKQTALRRALSNLIDNGFNYANKVSLNAFLAGKNLIVEIEDDGPGIPTNERENVFRPFYRLDQARNRDQKTNLTGSGLGMAIALDAVTLHGGKIKLSESSLRGLKATISIPF